MIASSKAVVQYTLESVREKRKQWSGAIHSIGKTSNKS